MIKTYIYSIPIITQFAFHNMNISMQLTRVSKKRMLPTTKQVFLALTNHHLPPKDNPILTASIISYF